MAIPDFAKRVEEILQVKPEFLRTVKKGAENNIQTLDGIIL